MQKIPFLFKKKPIKTIIKAEKGRSIPLPYISAYAINDVTTPKMPSIKNAKPHIEVPLNSFIVTTSGLSGLK